MKAALSTITTAFIILSTSITAFAKGGGFGALMAERSKMLHEAGYATGYAAGTEKMLIACVISASLALIVGILMGFFIGMRAQK